MCQKSKCSTDYQQLYTHGAFAFYLKNIFYCQILSSTKTLSITCYCDEHFTAILETVQISDDGKN